MVVYYQVIELLCKKDKQQLNMFVLKKWTTQKNIVKSKKRAQQSAQGLSSTGLITPSSRL
jgi:hypothetical protein